MSVIKVQNVSKVYDLGLVGTGTLYKDINRLWSKLRGKPDPYATIAELNKTNQKTQTGSIYALKDLNFEVEKGEILGIIGKNGAGKSTLLKLLSQITTPSSGEIKLKGRVASLLEVGTGMHPEMTARQNIFLNGAILGMTRNEIASKLDEIVEFAGIVKYIDTPIKRFSSGMHVRLGFAVAAFLDPEILIVDEVLAVGDADFQQRAIGKMQEVSRDEGRTVLFVSHNMESVRALCTRAMLIENGTTRFIGEVNEAINNYLFTQEKKTQNRSWSFEEAPGNENIKINSIKILKKDIGSEIFVHDDFSIEIEYWCVAENNKVDITFVFHAFDGSLIFISGSNNDKNWHGKDFVVGLYRTSVVVPKNLLNSGKIAVDLIFGHSRRILLYKFENAISFEIMHSYDEWSDHSPPPGLIRPKLNVETSLLKRYVD
jgi:lipopolysaccharide transport system ATP-binding protein